MNHKRIEELRKKIEYPYFTYNLAELKYLTGFTGSSAGLLVTHDDFVFITDSRYELKYKNIFGDNFLKVDKNLLKTLIDLLNNRNLKNICVNSTKFLLSDYQKIKSEINNINIHNADIVLDELRSIKNKDEIIALKKAIHVAEDAFLYILSFLKEGISEKDAAVELDHALKLKGADCAAFPLIVLFGEKTAYPHGEPEHNVKLKNGQVVLIDMGANCENYVSDLTRTFCFGYIPSDFKDVYYTVLDAQKKAFEGIKPGVKASDIDFLARDYINQKKYNDYFGHGLGHGIGMEVHEKPIINPYSETIIETGMVFSNEPGIYIPGKFGIRIEDMVVCRKNSAEWLTDLPKEKIICL